jgi:acetoacetate decarboxylase
MENRLAETWQRLRRIAAPSPRDGGGPWSRLASMVAPGDWIYRDAHYLAADVELDPAIARRWLPSPLRLATPHRARVFTAYFPHNTFGSVYREAGVFVDVMHRFTRAIYCPWMIVDDDVALITGRELLGYPKKLGEIAWEHHGDRIHAVACRRGHELISMTGMLADTIAQPPPILGIPHRNVRSSAGIAVPKLLAFTPRERVIEVRRAHLEVTIHGSERDPLHEMGFGRVLGARLHRVDLGGRLPPLPLRPVSPIWFARNLLIRSH